ncbi:Ribosomal protein S5 [Spironucleus salmonicida]|uniref:Small ribosomal subunit protein uS5 n=1 Tax=Spironucleus salmonicida TaxID=348837 RepID=V6LHQ5_9EUKA|nr:Ribosomal protein S5 [Spironucleus salmonicida]|eukprot:EST44087.1 Ribosomal protein S2 [Spironucleus salmonicida]
MSTERTQEQRGERGAPRAKPEEIWNPTTKLGRLVKSGVVTSLAEVFKYSLPCKEAQIIDNFITLEEKVVKVRSVQKQTSAGQRTRFHATVIVGDRNGHIGYGSGVSKEVAVAVKKAVVNAKLNLIPIRRGYWGSKMGNPHTISQKVSGKCGSVTFRLIPAPRGTGIVSAPKVKELIALAGIEDVFSRQFGHTRTLMNSVGAMFNALKKSYTFLTPDLWAAQELGDDLRTYKE